MYLLIVHDRHCDPTYSLYHTQVRAVKEARKIAIECADGQEGYPKEHQYDGWEYFAKYTCEDDYVKVIEVGYATI